MSNKNPNKSNNLNANTRGGKKVKYFSGFNF
jgi:hypothetical protein